MPTQPGLIEITVWYRGVVEGRLARQISNGLADAAARTGRFVQAFDNYVDLPDRVGVPCRSYARISSERIEEPYLYENHNPSIVICTDAALVKGCDVIKGLEPGGTLIVNTGLAPDRLLELVAELPACQRLRQVASLDAGNAHQPYTPQGGIEGASEKAQAMRTASLLLGAAARCSDVVSLESLMTRPTGRADIEAGYNTVSIALNPAYDPAAEAEEPAAFGFHGTVDLILPAQRPNGVNAGHVTGNYRILRPVVDQAACTACRICWAACPDACITMVDQPEQKVAMNLTYCKGCGICWEVCPRHCIASYSEVDFADGVVRITY